MPLIASSTMGCDGSDDEAVAEYSFKVLSVKADGSCFYSSIALVLADGFEAWTTKVWTILRDFWGQYARMKRQIGHMEDMTFLKVDADFIRFIAASSLEADDLDTYNNLCLLEGGASFDTIEKVKDDVMFNNAWANFIIVRSLLKGMRYKIGLIIFDTSERGLADLPVLWTQDKDLYIILELSGLHYSPVQLIREADGERMPLLLDQDTAMRALEKSD
jgi:hypothetical protein